MESFLRFAISIAAFVNLAEIAEAQSTCQTLTATQISQDIQNSPTANQTLRSASCVFGGAGVAESGGNSCSSNGNNFGILQLTRSNLPPGMTPEQYLALSPQQQIDIWAQQVGNSNTTGGYQTLANNSSIGGATVTPGMMAACFQFGPTICRNDINFMQANAGACPTTANGGVTATRNTLNNGTANLDGNNQSICSWGGSIQQKIDNAAATCTNACPVDTPNYGASPVAGNATQPSASSTDLTLPASAG